MRRNIILTAAILGIWTTLSVAPSSLNAADPAPSAGVAAEVRDWRYTLTIHEIAQADDDERLAKLVNDNPDRVLARLSDGRTPVHVAAEAGALKTLRVLGKAGADLNVSDLKGHTPLSVAIGMHFSTTVKTLVELGADVNHEGAIGQEAPMPPLNLAMKRGYADIVATLLDAHANLDQVASDGSTSLTAGAANGHLDAVKFLLTHGAKADAKNRDGDTALMLAARGGYADVVKVLFDAGADVNFAAPDGTTPLTAAAAARHWDVMAALLDHGAKVNVQDREGITALIHATAAENESAVKLLLDKGADPRIGDKTDRTALTLTKSPALWKLLVAKGADANAIVQGATPLQHFIADGNLPLVQAWLVYKPDPLIPDRKGLTAKELARQYAGDAVTGDRKEIARVLETYQNDYYAQQVSTQTNSPR